MTSLKSCREKTGDLRKLPQTEDSLGAATAAALRVSEGFDEVEAVLLLGPTLFNHCKRFVGAKQNNVSSSFFQNYTVKP